jgi:protein SCO1/2
MMRRTLVVAALLALAAPAVALPPGVLNRVDAAVAGGATLPRDATFLDQAGRRVALGRYFVARPSIVVLGWYGCSNLCSMVLQGVRQALHDAALQPGADVDVVVISIDPRETPAMARARAQAVLGDPYVAGWHFLTGGAITVDTVERALAYHAAYDDDTRQFAHPAGIAVVDREGRVVATLAGIVYPPATLRAALAGAAPVDALASAAPAVARHLPWLLCFGDDPRTGAHTRATTIAMRSTGVGGLGLLAGFVLFAQRRRRRREAGT